MRITTAELAILWIIVQCLWLVIFIYYQSCNLKISRMLLCSHQEKYEYDIRCVNLKALVPDIEHCFKILNIFPLEYNDKMVDVNHVRNTLNNIQTVMKR